MTNCRVARAIEVPMTLLSRRTILKVSELVFLSHPIQYVRQTYNRNNA